MKKQSKFNISGAWGTIIHLTNICKTISHAISKPFNFLHVMLIPYSHN